MVGSHRGVHLFRPLLPKLKRSKTLSAASIGHYTAELVVCEMSYAYLSVTQPLF